MNERPTELTMNVMSCVWGLLNELVQNPSGEEEYQARRFREARDYFDLCRRLARGGQTAPNFGNAESRRTYDQCIRFITMLEPLYEKYDPAPREVKNLHGYGYTIPVPEQDRT